jgi:cytochrome c oxidase subunit 2
VVARGSGAGLTARAAQRRGPGGARLVVLGITALGALMTLGGCSVGSTFRGFGWPEHGITPQAHRMYNLWIGSVVAALAVGFFVWGLIFWCVVRYRKKGDELPAQTRYNLPLELLYSVTPFLIVAVLFFYTATTETYVNKISSTSPDVTVHVVGHQWSWTFEYSDEIGADGRPITEVGTPTYVPVLVVPTNQRIRFIEGSTDVIHSFWVPELLFKRDVFPGSLANANSFEVTIEQEGAYVGRCAELCGTYHSMMNFEVRSVSPDKYKQFIQARRDGKSTPDALAAIGFDRTHQFAVTTHPFDTDPAKRSAS